MDKVALPTEKETRRGRWKVEDGWMEGENGAWRCETRRKAQMERSEAPGPARIPPRRWLLGKYDLVDDNPFARG